VIVKIVCDHVPLLEPISIILGSYREVGDRGNKGTSSDTPAEVVSKIEEKKTPDLRV